MKNKECASCKNIKPLTEFYVIKNKCDYYCKYCRNGYSIRNNYKRKDKKCTEGIKGCIGVYYAKGMCKNCYTRYKRNGTVEILNYGRKQYQAGTSIVKAEKSRSNGLMRRYKITPEQFDEMAKDGCHICKKPKLAYKTLHMDHDHSCCPTEVTCGNCLRGVLCDACNTAVGFYETNKLRDDYRNRPLIVLYVEMHKNLLSDKLKKHDKKQGHR